MAKCLTRLLYYMSKIKKVLMGFIFLVEIDEEETTTGCADTTNAPQSNNGSFGSYFGSSKPTEKTEPVKKNENKADEPKKSFGSYPKKTEIKNAFWEVQEDDQNLTAYDNHGIGIDLING